MQTGLLWFDSDPGRGLAAKIEEAARRYCEKFGRPPDVCYVNKKTLNGTELTLSLQGTALRVMPAANVLANHFWVGVEGR
jgi:hypothetical protein